MFVVSTDKETREFAGRQAAIEAARQLSEQHRGLVNVEDQEGNESLVYLRGKLHAYQFGDGRPKKH